MHHSLVSCFVTWPWQNLYTTVLCHLGAADQAPSRTALTHCNLINLVAGLSQYTSLQLLALHTRQAFTVDLTDAPLLDQWLAPAACLFFFLTMVLQTT